MKYLLAFVVCAAALTTTCRGDETVRSATLVKPIAAKTQRAFRTQHERCNDFIRRVGAMSLHTAEQSLAESESCVFPGMIRGGGVSAGPDRLAGVFEDRRVAKIYEAYAAKSKDLARKRALVLVGSWLNKHADNLKEVQESFSETGGYNISVGLAGSNHAVAASIFLLSQFGQPEDVAGAIERWERIGSKTAVTSADITLGLPPHPIDYDANPGGLLTTNLYLLTLQAHLSEGAFRDIAGDQMLLTEGNLERAEFTAWDALPIVVALPHRSGGAVDPDKVLCSFWCIRGWHSLPAFNKPAQVGFLNRTRTSVALLIESRLSE